MITKLNKIIISTGATKNGHTYVQWAVAIMLSCTLFNFGVQNSWVSPMTKILQSDGSPVGPLTDSEVSWIASSPSVAGILGVSMYSYIADAYGRKASLIAMMVPQGLSWIITYLSSNTGVLIFARAIAGIPAGGCFNLIPMYVKEISQDNIRGILVSVPMMFQNIGSLLMYGLGSFLDYYLLLWMFLSVTVVFTVLIILFVPESPGFLVKKGKIEEAAKTIAQLRGLSVDDKIVVDEIEFMKNEEHQYQTVESITFRSIYQNKAWFRGLLLGMMLITAQDCNGTFSVMTYTWTIMTRSGVTVNPELQTLSVPIVMIIGSVLALVCVEKFGRKPLLSAAFVVTMASWLCLGITLILQERGVAVPGYVPVVAIVVAVFAYSAGMVPMIYVILSEMFNFQVRAKLLGCIVTYAWLITAMQLIVYDPISKAFGMHTMFFIFAAANLAGALGVILLVPETMGQNVEQIEQLLLRKKTK